MTKDKDSKKSPKTLKLEKETLEDLDPQSEAAAVKGGAKAITTPDNR